VRKVDWIHCQIEELANLEYENRGKSSEYNNAYLGIRMSDFRADEGEAAKS